MDPSDILQMEFGCGIVLDDFLPIILEKQGILAAAGVGPPLVAHCLECAAFVEREGCNLRPQEGQLAADLVHAFDAAVQAAEAVSLSTMLRVGCGGRDDSDAETAIIDRYRTRQKGNDTDHPSVGLEDSDVVQVRIQVDEGVVGQHRLVRPLSHRRVDQSDDLR